MIRQATTDDAAQICEIYNHYVLETQITFEEQPVALHEMIQRIQAAQQSLPWLVLEEDRRLIGYCYASSGRADALIAILSNRLFVFAPMPLGRASGPGSMTHCWPN